MDESRREFRERYKWLPNLTKQGNGWSYVILILLLVWLLHFREGIQYNSHNAARVFNVHPFLMVFGFFFFFPIGITTYIVSKNREKDRNTHIIYLLMALTLVIVGICAAFKFNAFHHFTHFSSLHSWIGLATFCFFCLQWVIGFLVFKYPKASEITRVRMLVWHVCSGKTLWLMVGCAALTGFTDRVFLLGEIRRVESFIINFTALAIVLFWFFTLFIIDLVHYDHHR